MGELRIMDESGDSKIMWDPTNKEEVDAAKLQFDALMDKGYKAYTVSKDGSTDKLIKKFDKKLGKIVMVPQLVGG